MAKDLIKGRNIIIKYLSVHCLIPLASGPLPFAYAKKEM